ncbi:hypothetical protein L2E82_13283 [Cichorium intybus]|uniref:Uncharacterized protein n=1 Tax=Cichorium intybus TaxID=13427 RepID=A0ACB9GI73_CICIN|nr:hypothetical protein L2E82_13283 [Cichorium intybus]
MFGTRALLISSSPPLSLPISLFLSMHHWNSLLSFSFSLSLTTKGQSLNFFVKVSCSPPNGLKSFLKRIWSTHCRGKYLNTVDLHFCFLKMRVNLTWNDVGNKIEGNLYMIPFRVVFSLFGQLYGHRALHTTVPIPPLHLLLIMISTSFKFGLSSQSTHTSGNANAENGVRATSGATIIKPPADVERFCSNQVVEQVTGLWEACILKVKS